MFKRLLTAAMLTLCVFAASAEQITVDTEFLSNSQLNTLKGAVAEAAAKGNPAVAATGAVMTLASAATWGQQAATAAEGFAKALGIAARELGVTVNDFLHTDAGKITAILIIWKVAGAAVMKSLYGVLFITVGLSVARVLYLRLFTQSYTPTPYSRLYGLWAGTKMVRVPRTFRQFEADGEWLILWVIIFVVGLTLAIGSTFF